MAQWARMYTRFNANGARVTAPHTLESLVLRAGTVRTFNLSTLVFWAALLRPALTAPPTHTRYTIMAHRKYHSVSNMLYMIMVPH